MELKVGLEKLDLKAGFSKKFIHKCDLHRTN